MTKCKAVLIGMPSVSGTLHWLTVTSLMRLENPLRTGFQIIPRRRVDKARNKLAMDALKKGYDYLFFFDDDNPIPPDTLVKLLEDDKDIVSAPISTRGGDHQVNAYYGKEYDGIRIYSHIEQFRDEGYLHRIDACGMACTLIKRTVLEALCKKHGDSMFAFTERVFDKPIKVGDKTYKRRTMSEDFEFSERAVDAGFEIWLDTRIRPIHLTEFNYIQWEPANINTAEYWDKAWSREGKDTWRQYPLTFQKVAENVSFEDTVLDVGCGAGVLLDTLKPLCKDVMGLDISPKAIEILESRGIHGKVGTLPKIDFPDKSFDVVVATETLEHLDEPNLLLEEMKRVAREKIIISVPDNVLGPEKEKEHRQLFTNDSLHQLLSEHFEVVQIESFADSFQTPNVMIRLPTLLAVCNGKKAREVQSSLN